jgi:putative cell wall-binding protein
LATGSGYADALAAAALGAPVLLTRSECVPQVVRDEITRLAATTVVVMGGTSALSDDVRRLTVCS